MDSGFNSIPPAVTLENLIDPNIDSFSKDASPVVIQAIKLAIIALRAKAIPDQYVKLVRERDAAIERLNTAVDERDSAYRALADARREFEARSDEANKNFKHVVGRKAYYKGKVEKVAIVFRAACLLDVESIGRDVLGDALSDDPAERIDHPERFGD